MSDEKRLVRTNMIIKFGMRKVNKAKELAARIDHTREKIKAQTGESLVIEYFKKPWKSELSLSVEGYPQPVKLFLSEMRVNIETLGLKAIPENFYEI